MSPDEIMRLYDEYAPRLYALALRITGEEQAAADVLEDVFTSPPVPADFTGLVRITRERAIQKAGRPVVSGGGVPTPRLLVEEAFFRGRSVTDLAETFAIEEQAVRGMLIEGMAELRKQVAARE